MRTLHRTGLALAMAMGFALPLAASAEAAMGGALPPAQLLPVEQAQFFFLGHNFCWYDDGWQGPGWYWCNYAWNTGYGWGGGDGWRGWNRSAYHGRTSAPRFGIVNGTPRVNVVRAPRANVVRAPQFHAGAARRGAGPSRQGGGKTYTKPSGK